MRRRDLALLVALTILVSPLGAPRSIAVGASPAEISVVTVSPSSGPPTTSFELLLPSSYGGQFGGIYYTEISVWRYPGPVRMLYYPWSLMLQRLSYSLGGFTIALGGFPQPADYTACIGPYPDELYAYYQNSFALARQRGQCANFTVTSPAVTLSGLSIPSTAHLLDWLTTSVSTISSYDGGRSTYPLSGCPIGLFFDSQQVAVSTTGIDGTAALIFRVPPPTGQRTVTARVIGSCAANYLLQPGQPLTRSVLVQAADTIPPAVPTLSMSTTPVSWTATFASTDNPGGSGLASFVYSVGYQWPTALPLANGAASATTGQGVPGYAVRGPGTWYISGRAVDKAGNSSAWLASQPFTIPPRTPALMLGNLPDPLRIGMRYSPTATLVDSPNATYPGRPMAYREVRLTLGNMQAATRTDGAGNATFWGFSVGGPPGVRSGVLEFAGDVSGEVGPARVAFNRPVLPDDRPPSPPAGLAARFVTLGATDISWTVPPVGSLNIYSYRLDGGYESYVYSYGYGFYGGNPFQSGSAVGLWVAPGSHTFEVRARDYVGRFSDYARLTFTQPQGTTRISNWVWNPAPARLGSPVSTRADLTWSLPAGVFADRSIALAGYPLTFSLGSQTFVGSSSSVITQTVQAGPGQMPASVAYAGSQWYAPARLPGTLVVLANDTTPPSVPVVSVTPSVNTANVFTLQASSTDNPGGSGVERFDISIDGRGYNFLGGTSPRPRQPAWTLTYGPAPLAPSPGQHTVQVRARDAEGNISAAGAPLTFEWRRGTAHWSTSTTVQAACSGGTPVGTVTVRGVLLDQDNKPLAGRHVTITGGGVPNSAVTATDGLASFSGRTGTSFTLSYTGETNYAAATTQVTAPVQPPCATPTPTPSPTPQPTPQPTLPPATPAPPNYTVDIPPP